MFVVCVCVVCVFVQQGKKVKAGTIRTQKYGYSTGNKNVASLPWLSESVQPPIQRVPGRGVDHPPTSTAGVKERVELHLYSPSGLSYSVAG